jgi:hypothetical protein
MVKLVKVVITAIDSFNHSFLAARFNNTLRDIPSVAYHTNQLKKLNPY